MTEEEKARILSASKIWFRDVIAKNHILNTTKLKNPNSFKINPFLLPYLANFLTGNSTPRDIAKALIYPRVLGSSITTSFGANAQTYIGVVLRGLGTAAQGLDIEFNDAISGRKIYCQLKSGPDNINSGDVEPIINYLNKAWRTAVQNKVPVMREDFIVGVMFGEENELNGHYKNVKKEFPIYVGENFWHHLTGDQNFYYELSEAFAEVAKESNASEILDQVINELASSPKIMEIARKLAANS